MAKYSIKSIGGGGFGDQQQQETIEADTFEVVTAGNVAVLVFRNIKGELIAAYSCWEIVTKINDDSEA